MPNNDISPQKIQDSTRLAVIAPAGCGKTEAIAQAIKYSSGRQLVLTHTHAGVKSLLNRLRGYQIQPTLYKVETICSFALRISQYYPNNGDYHIIEEEDIDYLRVLQSATKIVNTNFGKNLIEASYVGLYVDEYQDCTKSQHLFIDTLSKVLPTRIFGDPLQGIFDFVKEELVDWDFDVYSNFETGHLSKPWRWESSNPDLGLWLSTARDRLISERYIDFSAMPAGCNWYHTDRTIQYRECFRALGQGLSVVAIKKFPAMAHFFAKGLKGRYTSIEEIECKDLIRYCSHFDSLEGNDFIIKLLEFSEKCISNVKSELSSIKEIFAKNKESNRLRKYLAIHTNLISIKENKDFKVVLIVIDQIRSIQGAILFRKELFDEMIKCIQEKILNPKDSLVKISKRIRGRASIIGRNVPRNLVARPPLIKGLQFNHSIVLDADELSLKELYVSITRGIDRLTIFSRNSFLDFNPL